MRFTGRVLPPATLVNFPTHKLMWDLSEYKIPVTITFKVSISLSVIDVECLNPTTATYGVDIYFARAMDLLRAATSLLSFSSGQYFYPDLDTVHFPDGRSAKIVLANRTVATLCTSFNPDNDDAQLVSEIVFSDLRLMLALRDLIDSQINPHLTAINCARVVDTIKHLITPVSGISENQKWKNMHSCLNTTESYIKHITTSSREHRHGKSDPKTGDELTEIIKRTWTVMDRFLLYKKQGDARLSKDAHPLLS
jgi:hypothetical protein